MRLGPSDKRRLAKIELAAAEQRKRTCVYNRAHDLSRLDEIDLADYRNWQHRREDFQAAHPGAALWEAIINGGEYPELSPRIRELI